MAHKQNRPSKDSILISVKIDEAEVKEGVNRIDELRERIRKFLLGGNEPK
jgi:hypothetical protein